MTQYAVAHASSVMDLLLLYGLSVTIKTQITIFRLRAGIGLDNAYTCAAFCVICS